MKITKTQIESAREHGACRDGIDWATAEPRTWEQLRKRNIGWYCWAIRCISPVEMLAKLAGDPSWSVRHAVAGNANTPVDVLEKLAGDPDRSIRYAVALNANTTADVLSLLANDPDVAVC